MNKDNFFVQGIFLSFFFVMPLYSSEKSSSGPRKVINLAPIFLHTGLHVPGGDSEFLLRNQEKLVRAPKRPLPPPVRQVMASLVYNARLGCVVARGSSPVVALVKRGRSATKGWKPGLAEVEEEVTAEAALE